MLHTFEFDIVRSDAMDEVAFLDNDRADPARAPRGLLAGMAVGAALWAAIIAALLSLG